MTSTTETFFRRAVGGHTKGSIWGGGWGAVWPGAGGSILGAANT